MKEGPILFAHIEKTAGTSVKRVFDSRFPAERVLIYDHAADSLIRASDTAINHTGGLADIARRAVRHTPLLLPVRRLYMKVRDMNEEGHKINPQFVPEDFDVLYGNFQADYFEDRVENPNLITVVRDPLERTISHYLQWRTNRDTIKLRGHFPFNADISFRDFAFREEMANFQTRTLGTKVLEDFDVVGTTEKLPEFLEEVGLIVPGQTVPHLNRSIRKERAEDLGIDSDFRRRFERQHALDYGLHQSAVDLFK